MASKKVCAVRGCPARNKADQTYFSIPTDLERRLQWLKLIGRPELHQNRLKSKNYVICSIHFNSCQINDQKQPGQGAVPTRNIPRKRKGLFIYSSNAASQTDFDDDDDDESNRLGKRKLDDDGTVLLYKRLKPNRRIYACCEIDCEKETSFGANIDVPGTLLSLSKNSPSDSIELSNRKIFVYNEDEESENKLNKLNLGDTKNIEQCAPVSNKVTNNVENGKHLYTGNDIVISKVFSLNEDSQTFRKFAEWRTRTTDRKEGANYEKDFNLFALSLHTINTRAYRLLMDSWKLPKEEQLKEIKLNIGPRFNERMTKLLGQKFKTLSAKGKYCTIGLYTMRLKPHLFYDPANDEIIGTHDVDGVKKVNAANYALIAMVRGLKVAWYQPVAFSLFTSMTDADNVENFLTTVFLKLKSMGLKIMGIVMPDDPCFWKYCRTKHFISLMKPYLNIANEKVYVVFDIPHILNMFKDDFVKNDFLFENKTVSWKFLKRVYTVDKGRKDRLLSMLSDKHMKAGNEDKDIKHPCQVLSKTVSGAMCFYINHGLLQKEAAPTAELIKKINDVFDVLNVTKPVKSIRNNDSQTKLAAAQAKALDNAAHIFRKLAKVVKNVDKDKAHTAQEPDSLKYFLITFRALQYINVSLKEAKQTGIVQTNLSYLDQIVAFVKAIQADAKTKKPTPIKFTRSFSKLFLKYLIDLNPPPTSIGNMENFLKMADTIKDCYDIYDGKRICLKDKDHRLELPETYAMVYISSFLLYKCSEKHMCKEFEVFLKRLLDLRRTKVYDYFEKYNKGAAFYYKLKLPPIEFPSYIERLDIFFLKNFTDFYFTYPAESLYRAMINIPQWEPPCLCFPFDYMLKLFARTRIYGTILHNTRQLNKGSITCDPYTLEVKGL